jgi:UDP-glucose 4-epimerase
MKVLITGGAGFIGSHLAEALLENGDEVSIIDDLSTGKFYNIAHLEKNKNFHYVIDTILNEEIMEKLIQGCDIIYHLAASVGVEYVINNPLQSLQTNIRGTEIVLELANKYKRKVLLTSTSEIYGKSDNVPFKEDSDRLLGPTTIFRWSYSTTKAVDEILALAYWRTKKLPVVVVRLFNVIGPRQTGQYGMVVPKFVKQALLGHPLTVYGSGKQCRCFAYVKDVVDGLVKLANSPKAQGKIFNLGNDQEISIEELASLVKELTNSSSEIEFIPYEKAYQENFEDMMRRIPDLTKIKNTIDYNPDTSLEKMITEIIEYFER